MIFQFISDDDWHFLFGVNPDKTSIAKAECAISDGFLKYSKNKSVPKNIITNIAFELQPKHVNLLENRKFRD
jgi:hypothetical protein